MKILFLTDNFYPEVNAPANRTYEHCREWVKKGVEVTVITSVPNFPKGIVYRGYKNKLFQKELIDGIKVIRVWSYITANEGVIRRIFDYVSYAIMAFFTSLFLKADVIVATSPQFFTAIAGAFSGIVKRRPWIMEVRDIWPESIVAVGAIQNKKIIRFLEGVEIWLYRKATQIIVVTDSFKSDLILKGINAVKISVIKNGVYLDKFRPIPKDQKIIKELNLENKFIIAYFGTHGMAHKLDFIINTAKSINDPKIHFLFIGDGAEKQNLIQLKERLNLTNVTLLPSVSKDDIQNYISIIDVALVNLKKSKTFKNVIPSKIFENAAMQKPILLGVEGESKFLIENYNAGACFEPENEISLIEKINLIKLNTDINKYSEGCMRLSMDFDRVKLANEMLVILRNTAQIY